MVNHVKTKCHNSTQNCPFSMLPKAEWPEFHAHSFPEGKIMKFFYKYCVLTSLMFLTIFMISTTAILSIELIFHAFDDSKNDFDLFDVFYNVFEDLCMTLSML